MVRRLIYVAAMVLGVAAGAMAEQPAEKGVAKQIEKQAASQKRTDDTLATQILSRLPKEMLPADGDTLDTLNDKNRRLLEWMKAHPPVRPEGSSVTIIAKLSKAEVIDLVRPKEKGGGKSQRLHIIFAQRSMYNGIPVDLTILMYKPLSGPADPMVAAAREWHNAGDDATFEVTAKVTSMLVRSYTEEEDRRDKKPLKEPKIHIGSTAGTYDMTVKRR